jgi:protein-S-isoprenylcysteine O-methyltransferase Ste14
MSWLPSFELGFWNAWILMLYIPLLAPIMKLVDKVLGKSDIYKKLGGEVGYQNGEKKSYLIYMLILLVLLLYSIFLPLKLGTLWFVIGLGIYLGGLAILLATFINVASIPTGRPFTRGIYRYSRHPAYLAQFLTFIGISVACASWVFFLLSFVSLILQNSTVIAEERACQATFGDEYQAYLHRTPRWIGLPKS